MKYKVYNKSIDIVINDEFNNKTLNDFLDFYKISKLKKYLYRDRIFINNMSVDNNTKLNVGDVLKIEFLEEEIDFLPSSTLPTVVYEDDFVLVVSKKDKLIIHSDDKLAYENTLNNDVAYYYLCNGKNIFVRPIHRLDYDTKGLIIYSKISFFQAYFDYLLSEKLIKRYYKTIVTGSVNFKKRDVDLPIGKDRHNNNRYLVSKTGKHSLTHVNLIKKNNRFSLLEVGLSTGRTHQIRVHLSNISYPIVNDELYGKKQDRFGLMLHAYKLEFKNIITSDKIVIVDSSYDLEEIYKEVYEK